MALTAHLSAIVHPASIMQAMRGECAMSGFRSHSLHSGDRLRGLLDHVPGFAERDVLCLASIT